MARPSPLEDRAGYLICLSAPNVLEVFAWKARDFRSHNWDIKPVRDLTFDETAEFIERLNRKAQESKEDADRIRAALDRRFGAAQVDKALDDLDGPLPG